MAITSGLKDDPGVYSALNTRFIQWDADAAASSCGPAGSAGSRAGIEAAASTLFEAVRALRKGHVTGAELDAALREAGDARAGELNCFTWRAGPEDAVGSDETPQWKLEPLWGIGGVVKANICVRDRPTGCGSRLLADWRPPYTSHAVRRLRRFGARIIGEGLDTLEELEMLGTLGISFGQGWLFGKPTPLRAS